MNITGTQVAYYHTCHRKLWLSHHYIEMEDKSDLVADGRLVGESSYKNRSDNYTQVSIDGIKIDFYDHKEGIVHETKRTNKMEPVHIAQLKYYIYILEKNGIFVRFGILEYPTQRQKVHVYLNDEDRDEIATWLKAIIDIIKSSECPEVISKPICKSCAYYDFCYINE